ncbi:MAG: fructosamine kinase family protein [Acidiferrobacterales bacterium]|nr:fructosamine kinase family protein [Acidiferrobacterales bacterium]
MTTGSLMDAVNPKAPLWDDVSACLQDEVRTVTALSNSSFSWNYAIECESNQYFLKLSADHDYTEAEADGLKALSAADSIRVPRLVACSRTQAFGFLIVEYLALNHSHPDFDRLGHDLARLHRLPADGSFGWHRKNYLGATVQINLRRQSWAAFFRDMRLDCQFERACNNGFSTSVGALRDQVLDRVTAILDSHKPEPSLLHGDLWRGNCGFIDGGVPVVFDPAVYVGDRETDLAMTRLFGGFPESFYESYHREWPLPSGWAQRQVIYNLYHILNHLNLFGSGYLQQALSMCRQLLAED